MIRTIRSKCIIMLGVLLTTAGCSDKRNPTELPTSGPDGSTVEDKMLPNEPIAETSGAGAAMLTEAQLAEYSKAALDGDGQAAFLVLMHYEMAMLDRRNGEFWAQIAAENGHLNGIISYTRYLLDIRDSSSCRRASFWVGRAKEITTQEESAAVRTLEEELEGNCSRFVADGR